MAGFANGMRDLLSVLEVDRVTVVGHSLGGGVAAQFAYQFPDRCERLVLVGSGGVGRTVSPLLRVAAVPGVEALMPLLGLPPIRFASRLGAGLLRIFDTALGRDAEEILAVFDALPNTEARMGILRTLRSSVDWHGQVITMVDRAYLAEGVPTLIVWGRRDAIIPLGHGRLIHTVMPGSEFEIFDEAGHFPHHTDPARFVRVLREFMERSTPARYDQRGGAARCSEAGAPRRRPRRRPPVDAPGTVPWRCRRPPVSSVPWWSKRETGRCCTAGWRTGARWCEWAPTCCGRPTRTRNPSSPSSAMCGPPASAACRGRWGRRGRTRAARVIEGDARAAPYRSWALRDEALTSVAELMDAVHRASASFDQAQPGLTWNDEIAALRGGPDRVS